MTAQPNTKLIQDLLSGLTIDECVARNKCSKANVFLTRRNLVRQGLLDAVIVKPNERRSKHYEKIVELYLTGVSTNKIAFGLKIRRAVVDNQIKIYQGLKASVVTVKSDVWRCSKHDSKTCWPCWHKEVTGQELKEHCMDYIYSKTI